MALLFIPLSLPAHIAQDVLNREMTFREVIGVKVTRTSLVVEHERISLESEAELLSCIEDANVV